MQTCDIVDIILLQKLNENTTTRLQEPESRGALSLATSPPQVEDCAPR
jgi:hypothetical protein